MKRKLDGTIYTYIQTMIDMTVAGEIGDSCLPWEDSKITSTSDWHPECTHSGLLLEWKVERLWECPLYSNIGS